MLGFFPKKLRNIIFYGAELENVDSKIFTVKINLISFFLI